MGDKFLKKIISVLSVIAILFSLAIIPSYAAGNSENIPTKASEDLIKNQNRTPKDVNLSQSTGQNEIDVAYQRVESEEEYMI